MAKASPLPTVTQAKRVRKNCAAPPGATVAASAQSGAQSAPVDRPDASVRRINAGQLKRKADKAGGQHTHISLHDDAGVVFPKVDMIDFDRALTKLEELDERQAMVVELRFFIGLTVDEVASELKVSPRTVKTDTQVATAWLRRELE